MSYETIKELPDISFIDYMDLDAVKKMFLEEYKKAYFDIVGEDPVLEKGDPIRLLMMAESVLIMQMLSFVDNAGKMNLLKYVYGEYADHMGVFKNRPRRAAQAAHVTVVFSMSAARDVVELIPAGTMVTADNEVFFETIEPAEIPPGELSVSVDCVCTAAGTAGNKYAAGEITTLVTPTGFITDVENPTASHGGKDVEGDAEYIEGIYNAPDRYSVAYTDDSWAALVKGCNSSVSDVVPSSEPGSGVVKLRILMEDGRLPTAEEIEEIRGYLMDPEHKATTVKLEVTSPEAVEFAIQVVYYIPQSKKAQAPDICAAVEKSVADYIVWQEGAIGRDINPDELVARIKKAGAKRSVIKSPVFQRISENSIAKLADGGLEIIYGGVESD